MNILTMARNLNFTQSVSGKHWQFLSQGGAGSDFYFKWLLWFLKSEIWGVRGSRVEAESPARGAVAEGPGRYDGAKTACLVNRTLFSWDDHLLLSNNTIVFLSFLYLWKLGRTQKTLYLNPTTLSASCWSSEQLQGHGPEQTALS